MLESRLSIPAVSHLQLSFCYTDEVSIKIRKVTYVVQESSKFQGTVRVSESHKGRSATADHAFI